MSDSGVLIVVLRMSLLVDQDSKVEKDAEHKEELNLDGIDPVVKFLSGCVFLLLLSAFLFLYWGEVWAGWGAGVRVSLGEGEESGVTETDLPDSQSPRSMTSCFSHCCFRPSQRRPGTGGLGWTAGSL